MLEFKVNERFMLTRSDGRKIQIARIEIPGLKMNGSQFEGSILPNRSGERRLVASGASSG